MKVKQPDRRPAPMSGAAASALWHPPGTPQASGKPRIIAKISNTGNALADYLPAAHEPYRRLPAFVDKFLIIYNLQP